LVEHTILEGNFYNGGTRMPVLNEIKDIIGAVDWGGNIETEFKGLQYDSRRVVEGDLFVAIRGFHTDGHDFIPQAVEKGAVAVVIEHELSFPLNIPWVKVADSRLALSRLSALINDYPSRKLRVIGVTGTNGKTTTTYLIESILHQAGRKVGLIGTIENRIAGKPVKTQLTTPDSPELQGLLTQMVAEGVEYAIMEASSHALKLKRVADCEFDVAVFTNLTQDHLDFHPTFNDYLKSKAELFWSLHLGEKKAPKYTVINLDDPCAGYIIERTKVPVITYGIVNTADVSAKEVNIGPDGTAFKVVVAGIEMQFSIKLIGRFAVYNTLAAFAVALKEGIDLDIIKKALEEARGVPGRFEIIDEGQDFTVIVDYAHTPDGLKNILETVKEIARGKIITVFGCGGDRDKKKRPLMGEAAAVHSDYCIITSDNPRSEEPMTIIEDIIPGVKNFTKAYSVVENRREAINEAIRMARKGDTVVIAGKGHETYQIVGNEVFHFDDREEARKALRSLRR